MEMKDITAKEFSIKIEDLKKEIVPDKVDEISLEYESIIVNGKTKKRKKITFVMK